MRASKVRVAQGELVGDVDAQVEARVDGQRLACRAFGQFGRQVEEPAFDP
jgi:hypothetical protein